MMWFVFPMVRKTLLSVFLSSMISSVSADEFEIKEIIIEGNQRISFETVRSYLPVEIGDILNSDRSAISLKQLYQTKFFKDIALYKEAGGVLKIVVLERPSIADITIEGNELIKTEDLETALSTLGMKKGRIFNKNQLEKIVVDLRRQYQNQGYYAAEIEILVEKLPRNRVSLKVNVEEGKPAGIGRITLVGNKTYDDDRLKSRLLLSDVANFGNPDSYAKPKLLSDEETIKSYYMDRGFAEFEHKNSQVSLSLDKTKVYITINFVEGPQYDVSEVKFSGETIIKKDALKKLQRISEGDLYSRSRIVATVNKLRDRLSEEGYAFAKIEPITKLDKEKRSVSIDFRIEPKKRVYVRRILIKGNTRTRDHVIRREFRQLESAPYSLKAVRRSNARLNRLGFFKQAKIDTKRVADDLVDLVVAIEEQSTGSFNAGIGYSQIDGANFTVGVTERNVLGSGYKANLNGSFSKSTKSLDIGVTNPYFTDSGVSLGGGIYFREINAEELGGADYTLNNYGVRLSLSYPISERSKLSFSVKLDDQTILCSDSFLVCSTYVGDKGKHFNSVKISAGWSYDTRNAFYFPSKGQKTSLSTEVTIPTSSDVSFYKIFADESIFLPINKNFTFKMKLGLSYGSGYNDNSDIPFYENFYAGGIGSVRGYEPNSLGSIYNLVTDGSSRASGGSFRAVSTAELIFPMPFVEASDNLRLSLFVDAGNVFQDADSAKIDGIRTSTGLGISWITPVGPLSFSFARPLNDREGDKTQVFQFNLGVPL